MAKITLKTNASQKSGKYSYASVENQWKAFERLPKSVRDALNEAAFSWAPYTIWRRWNRGQYRTAEEIVAAIKSWDQACHDRDAKKDGSIIPQKVA